MNCSLCPFLPGDGGGGCTAIEVVLGLGLGTSGIITVEFVGKTAIAEGQNNPVVSDNIIIMYRSLSHCDKISY